MATRPSKKRKPISYVPTDTSELYPSEDGKPMAVSDYHRQLLIWVLQALEAHFAGNPGVYISGDILMYYLQGFPRKVISPDVLVAFGLGMKPRLTYKVWEEGKVPEFVMEFSSKTTYRKDLNEKMVIYSSLGIQNYVLYDAEGLYLPEQLMGFTLVDGNYVPILPSEDGGFHSSVLGLDFHIDDGKIRIYDPTAGKWVQTIAEQEAARADQEAIAREKAEVRAEKAEEEAAQLREQLARLQAHRE